MRRIILCVFLISACGYRFQPPIETMKLSMDAVKLIARGEERGDLDAFFNQDHYDISNERRLLLRFESLDAEVDKISVEGGKKVWVEINVYRDADIPIVLENLKLCPVTRSWMMLATWTHGHPFGKNGRWESEGGDYDLAGCLLGELKEGSPHTLHFDATQWFINYPRARRENYGFLLISEKELSVQGEQAGTSAPKLAFDSYLQ